MRINPSSSLAAQTSEKKVKTGDGAVCFVDVQRYRIVCKPAMRTQTSGGSPREQFRGRGHTMASHFGRKQAPFPFLYPTDNSLLTCWTSRENRQAEEQQQGQPNQ